MHLTYVAILLSLVLFTHGAGLLNTVSAQCGAACSVNIVSIGPRLIEEGGAIIEESVKLLMIAFQINLNLRIFLESRSCKILR